MIDKVTNPFHYQFSHPCHEVRDVIKDRLDVMLRETGDIYLAYDYSNAIKYLLRAFAKNGREDLEKAKYCIECLLEKTV